MSESLPYQQQTRPLRIESTLGEDALLLASVSGEDGLSQCFVYTIEFFTAEEDADIRGLIGKPVTLWLQNDQDTPEPINGYVRRVTGRAANYRDMRAYRAEVVPRLWFMDCTSDCRIFQNMTYPDIIKQMLTEYGVTDNQISLFKTDYPVAEYCVQYRESALAFISRLMEQIGLFYYHEHSATKHVLKISDINQFTVSAPAQPLRVSGQNVTGEITTLESDTIFRTGAWTLCDYDFEGPTKQMQKQAQTMLPVSMMSRHEQFEFPGGYTDQSVGAWLTKLRIEAEEAHHNRLLGTGPVACFMPGRRFKLDADFHGIGEGGEKYLVTEARHFAVDNTYFPGAGGSGSEYRNEFVMIPSAVPFRPLRKTPKSVVRGSQTATVVSPSADDPIQVDQYGRVKIFFHWDRRGKPAEGATSCWVRVSQNSAGGGFGGISIPHAGQEVVVDFLEGDPDRPLIVGRVHNADKTASTNLPSDKHKTITRDHGGNKIAMHGKSGTQHVSLITPGSLNMFARAASANSLSSASTGNGAAWPTLPNNPAAKGYGNVQAAANLADSDSSAYSQGTIGMDANTVTDGDVNIFSQGDNNAWSVGNRNVYVAGNLVSWVTGNATSTVVVNVNDTVNGDVTEAIKGKVVRTVGGNVTEQISGHRLILVGTNDTLGVDADVKVDVSGKYVRTVGGNVTDQIAGHQLCIVSKDNTVGVDGKQVFNVTGDVTMTSTSGQVSISAASQISLSVGGNSIVISQSGITITGAGPVTVTAPTINMNC